MSWFLDLSPGYAYQSIVQVPSGQTLGTLNFIEPGDPEMSYLWHKLNGTQSEVGGYGNDMPMGMLTRLTPQEIETIEAWILAGAPM